MNRCCSFWGRYSKHPREIWDQESRWRLRRQSRESSLSPSDFSRGEDNLAAEAAWLLGNLNAMKLWAGWIGQTELCRGSQWWSIKLMPRGQNVQRWAPKWNDIQTKFERLGRPAMCRKGQFCEECWTLTSARSNGGDDTTREEKNVGFLALWRRGIELVELIVSLPRQARKMVELRASILWLGTGYNSSNVVVVWGIEGQWDPHLKAWNAGCESCFV